MAEVGGGGSSVGGGVGNTQVEPSHEPPELEHAEAGSGVEGGGVYSVVGYGVGLVTQELPFQYWSDEQDGGGV